MTPVLLAAILHHNQQRGPAEIPDKRTYTYKNLIRLAHDLGLPIQPPPGHPFNPLLPLRLATLRPELCLPLFKKCWAEGKAIDQKEQLQSWLPCEWLDECQSPAVKEKLRLNTERAISLGVFGVPSMVVKNEVFWGFDSFPHLERFLQGKDPVTAEQVAQWRDLPVAASRF